MRFELRDLIVECSLCRRQELDGVDVQDFAVDPAHGLEQHERLPDRGHIVNAQDLYPLPRQRQGGADGTRRAIGLLVGEHLADKSLSRVADHQRTAEPMQPMASCQQRQIVLMALAEADARVQRNPIRCNSRRHEHISARLQMRAELRPRRRRRSDRPAWFAACLACA